MGNYEQLKQAVSDVIKTNGTQSITGALLQNTLTSMISSLGANYQFVGIATENTNPGTPDQNVFYIGGEGTYANFDGITIEVGQLGVLKWNGYWIKQVIEIGGNSGNMILEWNTSPAITRKQVPTKYRKQGLQISYKNNDGIWINEQYIGTNLGDEYWELDGFWQKIANETDINDLSYRISIISGGIYSKQYELKQGVPLNTTSAFNIFKVSIPENSNFIVLVETDEGTENIASYLYKEDGTFENKSLKNGEKSEIVKDYKIVGIGIYIPSPTSNGYAVVNVEFDSKINQIENSLFDIKKEIYGEIYSRTYNIKTGVGINTTSPGLGLEVSVEANETFYVQLSVTDETTSAIIYYYKEDGSFQSETIQTNKLIEVQKDYSINKIAFYIASPTADGTATMIAKLSFGLKDEVAKIPIIEQKILDLENITSTIQDENYERAYQLTQGKAINTTSPSLRLNVDIKENQYFKILLTTTDETNKCFIYYYKNSTEYISEEIQIGYEYILNKPYDIIGIGFYIASPTADGTATINVQAFSKISENTEDIKNLKYQTDKITLSDVLAKWMKGEKFPIGFHGDSTTDGTSTTGWTVENSHPAKDEEAGGRGKADYICERAYPYILQEMLRTELKNQNLRIYNIGYYGASLINNYGQLKDIYGYAYSDVKMVGLMLSINDRGSYTSLADYYNGVREYLIKYIDFYKSKGIIPFMVLQQAVTQGGNDGTGQYKEMHQNYTQTIANKAKIDVAKLYGLEVIDVNSFDFLLLTKSNYAHNELTENLHFKDLGHKLEAQYLFSELIPWVEKTDGRSAIYLGILAKNCKSEILLTGGSVSTSATGDKFKQEINYQKSDTNNKLIYEYYILNNTGQYKLAYMTPQASGYIMINDVRHEIDSTEVDLGIIDIGLHKLQVYTGENNVVAFKGFKIYDLTE